MPPIAKKWHRTRNILSYPFGWQYPAITEQHAFERICMEFPDLQSCTYIGFPWATLIDFLQTGREEKATPYLEKLVGIPANRTSVTITVSQHIYAARYIKLFESAGITDLFWSHATKGTEQIGSIRIHPFPLFPVRCQDEPDRSAKPLSDRRHLFSFVGAYDPKHYLTAARDWIGRLPRSTEGVIRVTKEWHFFSEVYERQIFDTPVAEEKRAHLNLEAAEYRSLLADSVFSLCPSGSGPNSIRLWESLGFGCIPVVISDSLRLPGDLDEWQKAVIFIPEDERSIAELPDTLRAIAKDVNRLQDYVQAGQSLWKKYGPENFIHDILLCAKSRNEQIDIPGSDCQLNVSRRHVISPDNFAEYSYAKRHHFSNFGDHDLELFNKKIDPDYCDLKAYQDLLVFAFIKDTIPKGSRILDVGGGESRILNHFKNDYECWNIDKLEGSGNGPREIHHDGYRLVRDYMGNFSNELPEGYFDFVFSISSLEHVPYGKAEHRELHKNICLDIDRVLKPGGMSLHCFDITVSATKDCWTNDLAPFMAECFPINRNTSSFKDIARDPQLFCVSERYFNEVWKQHPAVAWNYGDGKPSSWNIMWQKPLNRESDESAFGWHNIAKYVSSLDDTHPKISVITPSFNQAEFLEECIQSILGQHYPNLEYVVMDGGSTDGSVEIIKRYAQFITYWQSKPDGGQYQGIEDGFRKSSGEIMTWLNSDDKFHRNAFSTVTAIFSSRPNVDWIMGRPNGFDETGAQAWVFDYLPGWSREKYLRKQYRNPYIQQEGTFWRRALWDKAGARMETGLKLAGDLELWTRFFRYAQLHTVDALLAGYRSHPAQKTRNFLEQYHEEAEQVLDREIRLFRSGEVQTLLPAPPPLIPEAYVGSNSEGYLVSAIVSTYNAVAFIRGCLEDLTSQTLYQQGKLEIIVVDSGSTQNEAAVVNEFRSGSPHIRYLRTERESLYAAWNRGIEAASGKYLTNANTDDRHRHDALEVLSAHLDRTPEIDLVYADCYVSSKPNETFAENDKSQRFSYPTYFAPAALLHYQFGPQPMWRRTVHEQIGMFDDSFRAAGDYDFNLRFAARCQARHIPEPLGLYLEHLGAITFRDETMERENRRIADLYKNPDTALALYACAGVQCETDEEKAEALLDLGLRALRYYPPWKLGDEESNPILALRSFAAAIEIIPSHRAALNNAAATLCVLGNCGEAEQLLAAHPDLQGDATLQHNLEQVRRGDNVLRLMPSSLRLPGQGELATDLSVGESSRPSSDAPPSAPFTICMVASVGRIDPFDSTGGLETAMRHSATALAERGHRVALVGNLHRPPGSYDGVVYIPINAWRAHDFPQFSRDVDILAFASGPDLRSYEVVPAEVPKITIFHHQKLAFLGADDPLILLNHTADAVICVSGAVRDDLARNGVHQRKLRVVHNGVNHRVFYPRPVHRETHRILFVGALVPDKNVELLIRAFLSVSPEFPGAELHLCGGASLWGEPEYIDREAVARLSERIHFHGVISHDKLAEQYSLASICVIPSKFESFSLVSLEAQACGCVPLTADIGGLSETMKPGITGFTYAPNDLNTLVGALRKLLAAPERVRQAGLKAQQFVAETFSWSRTARQYEEVFLQALQQGTGRETLKKLPGKTAPRVSVVIPCYNYGRFLQEAVESVLGQTFQDFEIIIVNDGSTDDTSVVAERLIADHPQHRIRLISQDNSGQPAASRNRGISEARGEFILPLDADDKTDLTMIEKMIAVLDNNCAVDIVYCDTVRFGDVNNSYQTGEWNLQRLATINILNYCALYRKKVWEDVGGYRLNCGYEDWDFWISAAEKGFMGYRIPEYLFYYRIKKSGRLAIDQQNDKLNKAKIVHNHPKLYDKDTLAWARRVLTVQLSHSSNLQVLIVVHNFPPHWFAGVENYTYHLAKSLSSQGIQTSVLYSHHRDGIPEPALEEETYDGIRVFKLVSDYNSPHHSDLSTQITHAGKESIFADFLQRNRFDVIHFHHTKGMPFSFIRIAREQRLPVCVTLHDFWFLCVNVHLYNEPANSPCNGPYTLEHCVQCLRSKIQYQVSPEEQSILNKWIHFRISHAMDILQNVESIVSPSRYLADIYHRFGISKHIEIYPLGLNNLRKSFRSTSAPVVFGFLGMIHDLKNVYLLADAFKATPGDAHLKYFGNGADHHIQKLLATIEGDERISYHGKYLPEQLSDILDQIDIVVLPSMTENYPLVVREAFSAGVPVLASRIGGIPEIVTHLHDGILFNPTDKEELRKWLQMLIEKPSLVAEIKKNIRPVKSIEQDAQEWALRYSQLSGNPPEKLV